MRNDYYGDITMSVEALMKSSYELIVWLVVVIAFQLLDTWPIFAMVASARAILAAVMINYHYDRMIDHYMDFLVYFGRSDDNIMAEMVAITQAQLIDQTIVSFYERITPARRVIKALGAALIISILMEMI